MSVVPGLISVEQAGGQRSEVGTCADQEQNHSEQWLEVENGRLEDEKQGSVQQLCSAY